jgi:hypothetical protein
VSGDDLPRTQVVCSQEDLIRVTERTDRTKAVFRELGVRFTLIPMGKVGESPYYRAEGETDIANAFAGQFAVSPTGLSGGRAEAARNSTRGRSASAPQGIPPAGRAPAPDSEL